MLAIKDIITRFVRVIFSILADFTVIWNLYSSGNHCKPRILAAPVDEKDTGCSRSTSVGSSALRNERE